VPTTEPIVVAAHPGELVYVVEHVHHVTGMGKVSAAAGLAKVLSDWLQDGGGPVRPPVVNLGTCGALTNAWDLGDVVQVGVVRQHGTTILTEEQPKEYTLASLTDGGGSPALPAVVCATGDTFVTSRSDRAQVRSSTGASIVDMELFAYAHVCKVFGFDLYSVKVVSDTPGQHFGHWLEALDAAAQTLGRVPWKTWLP
jgi:adenosylhomocysteine nucleosidase